jgi:hypothetical protein
MNNSVYWAVSFPGLREDAPPWAIRNLPLRGSLELSGIFQFPEWPHSTRHPSKFKVKRTRFPMNAGMTPPLLNLEILKLPEKTAPNKFGG